MQDKFSSAIPLGRYRHYKGGEYEVISVARHSETEEPFVVYQCLADGRSWWIRPLAMFTEMVNVCGEIVPRFAYLDQ